MHAQLHLWWWLWYSADRAYGFQKIDDEINCVISHICSIQSGIRVNTIRYKLVRPMLVNLQRQWNYFGDTFAINFLKFLHSQYAHIWWNYLISSIFSKLCYLLTNAARVIHWLINKMSIVSRVIVYKYENAIFTMMWLKSGINTHEQMWFSQQKWMFAILLKWKLNAQLKQH